MSGSRFRFGAWAILGAALLVSTPALWAAVLERPAQEETAQDPQEKAADDKDQGEVSAVRAAYDAAIAQWKERLKRLRDLRVEYATTVDKEKVKGIEENWKKTIDEVNASLPDLIDKAEAAYKESPNTDPQLSSFIYKIIEDAYKRDDVDLVLRLSEVLIQGEADYNGVFDMAGYAAYCLNDFDKAKEYLEKAQSLGVLSSVGEDSLGSLETVRKNWEEEVAIRAKEADDAVSPDQLLPRVLLVTSVGEIELELFENEAPETVGNFISLVESGFYTNQIFHRVIPHFMVQGGCPKGNGQGDPGYSIYCEVDKPGARKHFRGTLSMAKLQARDTGGSQFFLCLRPTPHLDGRHTVFGRVVKGLEVLSKIERTEAGDPSVRDFKALPPTQLLEAKVLRKRDHEYKPNKVQ